MEENFERGRMSHHIHRRTKKKFFTMEEIKMKTREKSGMGAYSPIAIGKKN
jgi:hypothetical protein